MNHPSNNPWWNRSGLAAALLVAITVIAYQPAWNAGYIWDDDVYVTKNSLLTATDGLKRIWFSLDSPSQYFPLTYTTFRLERTLWGLNASGYHWMNILLHSVNALLVWQLLQRLKIPGAWLAAGIFALHPVNVESVAWISELKNVQSLFFCLLALLAWVRFVDDEGIIKWRWYGLALLFYLLGLFSKTTACTLPAALLLILWWKRKPVRWNWLVQMLPFLALGMAMGLVSMWWERHHQGTEGKAFALGLLERLLIASRAVWFYLGKLLWPANLTFNYPLWKINVADPLAYVWLAAGVVVVAMIVYARRFVGRGLETATLYYVATLSPLLGFIMLYTFHYSFVADHYQYMACLGPMALAAAGIAIVSSLFGQKRSLALSVFGAVLLAGLGALTWRQAGMYADLETLWRTTLARNPNSFMAYNNLGDVLLKQGRQKEAMDCFQETLRLEPDSAQAHCNLGVALFQSGRADEAIRRYQKALELQPGLAEAHKNLADAFLQLGRVEEALAHSRKAVELRPEFAEAQNNLGNALLNAGRVDEAIGPLRRALELQPDFPNALNNLGVALIQKGSLAEAMDLFQKAVELQPDFAEAHNNLGRLQLQKGMVREALVHYHAALKAQPEDPDTLCNLAWVLATWPDASVRDGAKALEFAQRANDLSGGRSCVVLGTLAAAYAETGRYTNAVETAERGLRIAESQSNSALAELLRSQIRLHQAGSPVRDNGTTEGAGNSGPP